MNVLVNAVSAVLGGGLTVARRLTAGMARLRPDHRFLLCHSHEDAYDPSYPPNVESLHLPRLASRRLRWQWEQFRLPSLIGEREIDVVLVLGGYVSFRTRVPQVSVWQNSNVFSPPGIKRPPAEHAYIWLQRRMQTRSMARAAQNVFLTDNSIELARRWWDMDRVRCCRIYNGVDAETLPERPAPLEGREPLVLSIGHAFYHKNYEALIDAMAAYRERHGPGLRLEIVGGAYQPDYSARLEQRIRERNLSDVIDMSGPANRDELLLKLARARVYVVTSLLETFGLTLLEAMGSGVPVVASRTTCHPEVGGNAVLYCDPHDPADIADKIHTVVSDPALQATMRERGFARLKHFTWERAAADYLRELEAAAGAPG